MKPINRTGYIIAAIVMLLMSCASRDDNLIEAAGNGHTDVVEQLIKAGADMVALLKAAGARE